MRSNITSIVTSFQLLICVLLLQYAHSSDYVSGPKPQKTVIVVGAGVSGITAARYLLNYTDFRVIVLEASNRTAGRVYSYPVPDQGGKKAELGAVLIRMGEWAQQPIRKYCDEHGIETKWFNLTVDLITSHLNHSANDFQDPQYAPELVNALRLFAAPGISDPWWANPNLPDKSVIEAFQEHENYSLLYNSMSDYGKRFYEILLQVYTGLPQAQKSARLFEGVKPKRNTETIPWPHEAQDKIVPSGYNTVVNSLISTGAKPVDVRLNTIVKKINVKQNEVEITTTDNEKLTSHYAILTVPIGVMKAKTIEIQPPLSTKHQQALSRIGAANFIKFLIVFDQPFWPMTKNRFFFIPTSPNGIRVHFINHYLINELPALMCHITAQDADLARKLTDEQLLQQMLTNLKTIFPSANPVVTYYIRKDWTLDPFTKGDYCSPLVGMTFDDAYNVREVHKKRLMFAGELTAMVEVPNASPGVVGAFLSGYRTATEIMQAEGLTAPPKPYP